MKCISNHFGTNSRILDIPVQNRTMDSYKGACSTIIFIASIYNTLRTTPNFLYLQQPWQSHKYL
jgi:hypothetical protein